MMVQRTAQNFYYRSLQKQTIQFGSGVVNLQVVAYEVVLSPTIQTLYSQAFQNAFV